MSSDIAIKVENLSKCYQIYGKPSDRLKQMLMRGRKQYYREFWALKDVSFEVKKGETLGIIGRNGSGKSTLLQLICGTLSPTSGSIETRGRIAALLELGSGFNPEFTGRENVYMNGAVLGLGEDEIKSRFAEIADFADIGDFMEQPVKTYSSGMFVRLAFAVQAHIDASIVVIDEALAVGDIFFRQKCYSRLDQLKKTGSAILLVSHSMPDIEQYCSRAILLDQGAMRFLGSSSEAAKHYYLLNQGHGQAQHRVQVSPSSTVAYAASSRINRPSSDACVDLTNKSQVSNGQARCVYVALCNDMGQPLNSFHQGDRAFFFYEFELNENIGVPICGLVIKNERGVIVHGKNSWQYAEDVVSNLNYSTRLICKQEVGLDLCPGEYIFEIGLASVSSEQWENKKHISHEEMSSFYVSVCQVANAGCFSVGMAMKDGVSVLTHHGIADLPGKIQIDFLSNREIYEFN